MNNFDIFSLVLELNDVLRELQVSTIVDFASIFVYKAQYMYK